MLDEPEAALGPLRTCTAQMPGWRAAFVWLAATCERLGMTQEARDAAAWFFELGRALPLASMVVCINMWTGPRPKLCSPAYGA